jgi:hypothetical protein
MTEKDNVVQLAPRRRRKQERRVVKRLNLTPAEHAEAEIFISPAEMDQLIFNDEISDAEPVDEDKFPMHPWTGS